MKPILVTNWYEAQTPQRKLEIEFALYKNLTNPAFSEVRLWSRTSLPNWVFRVPHVNLVIFESERYPTFYDLFWLASTYNDEEDTVKIVSNTDIYFNESIKDLFPAPVEVVCLSRWERKNRRWSLYRNHKCSQDSWIFRDNQMHKRIFCNFRMGMLGCDNRLAYEFDKAGFYVTNPSLTVKSFHVHFSDHRFMQRNEHDVVPPPYKLVPAL